MKKILFAAVALVAMASCATDEVVMRPENKLAIEFDNAFVENSTRAADITASNLNNFSVYGSIANTNGTGLTFNNTVVSKNANTGAYEYSPAQVWANNATYTFVAFAPAALDPTTSAWSYAVSAEKQAYDGVITFNNKAAQANQDLLFASEKRKTEVIESKPEAVALTFNHMLSRVKFHFTNSFHAGSNVDLEVTNVKITNAHSTGELAVTDGQVADDWTVGTETFSRNFGGLNNASLAANGGNGETEHFYLIPTAAEYNVEFDVKMTVAGGASFEYHHTALLNINMEKGHSYVVKTSLNQTNTDPQGEMYAIEFKVEKVEDWKDFSDVALDATTVADANALATAVAAGGNVRLTENITLPAGGLSVNTNAFIDLNGYTLTVLESNFENNANLIISNGTISGSDTQLGRRAIVNKGNLTMNNITVAQVYAGGGSAINNDGATAVAVLNNVTVNAQNMAVSNKNGATMTINGGNFVGNGTGGSYAIVNQLGSTMTINGGTFEGGHGVVSSTEGSVTTLNGGTYHCTCTYTGNSDWVLFAGENSATYGAISYNAANCKFTTARADDKIWWDGCASYITSF